MTALACLGENSNNGEWATIGDNTVVSNSQNSKVVSNSKTGFRKMVVVMLLVLMVMMATMMTMMIAVATGAAVVVWRWRRW